MTRTQQIQKYVDRRRDDLVSLVQQLVRTPSENVPPNGDEAACQHLLAERLRTGGFSPDLYYFREVAGLEQHPLYWHGRDYSNRPNLACRVKGKGAGKSLILSGHIDTVPRGAARWMHDPFAGTIEGTRLYGRGAWDMKAGVAMHLFALEAVRDLELKLKGDLLFESVVDEEFGGVNGTLAGRLRGYLADAALISEPTTLRICNAQRGGRLLHITFRSTGDIFSKKHEPVEAVDQLTYFLVRLPEFIEQRLRDVPFCEDYGHTKDPLPVTVTAISTGTWGVTEPITVPSSCRVELFYQTMPGETQNDAERQFFQWFRHITDAEPDLFVEQPDIQMPIRWLPGSRIPRDHELVTTLSAATKKATGAEPKVEGLEAPCDMYVFHQAFQTPAVLWGPAGANAHLPNEYVDIDSLVAATKALLQFITDWCGVQR